MRLSLLLALATWILPGCTNLQPASSPEIRVLSFNIRYGTAADGSNHWHHRKDDVLQTIVQNDADILGVQEALHFQRDAVIATLPEHECIGVSRDGADGSEYSALFVRKQRFEIEQSGTRWLSPTPQRVGSKGWDAALPRIVTWAVLRDRQADARLLVCNTHFDHRGKLARQQSANCLLALRAEFAELPAIVMGDLNSSESSAPLATLRGGGFRDTFRVAHPGTEDVGTFSGFRGNTSGGKIDYVLCSDAFEVASAWIDRTKTADGRDPSDHYPVGAVLQLAEPTGY